LQYIDVKQVIIYSLFNSWTAVMTIGETVIDEPLQESAG
jgi:hypothetical protein